MWADDVEDISENIIIIFFFSFGLHLFFTTRAIYTYHLVTLGRDRRHVVTLMYTLT